MGLSLRWQDAQRRLSIALSAGSRMRPPLTRDIVVGLAGSTRTQSVKFSGRPLSVSL